MATTRNSLTKKIGMWGAFAEVPIALIVRTYSTHYEIDSRDLKTYADWYRLHEQPKMTDAEFRDADDFVLELSDFRERFGPPRSGK